MQEMVLVVKGDIDLLNAEKVLKGLYFHLKQKANGVNIQYWRRKKKTKPYNS